MARLGTGSRFEAGPAHGEGELTRPIRGDDHPVAGAGDELVQARVAQPFADGRRTAGVKQDLAWVQRGIRARKPVAAADKEKLVATGEEHLRSGRERQQQRREREGFPHGFSVVPGLMQPLAPRLLLRAQREGV